MSDVLGLLFLKFGEHAVKNSFFFTLRRHVLNALDRVHTQGPVQLANEDVVQNYALFVDFGLIFEVIFLYLLHQQLHKVEVLPENLEEGQVFKVCQEGRVSDVLSVRLVFVKGRLERLDFQ